MFQIIITIVIINLTIILTRHHQLIIIVVKWYFYGAAWCSQLLSQPTAARITLGQPPLSPPHLIAIIIYVGDGDVDGSHHPHHPHHPHHIISYHLYLHESHR